MFSVLLTSHFGALRIKYVHQYHRLYSKAAGEVVCKLSKVGRWSSSGLSICHQTAQSFKFHIRRSLRWYRAKRVSVMFKNISIARLGHQESEGLLASMWIWVETETNGGSVFLFSVITNNGEKEQQNHEKRLFVWFFRPLIFFTLIPSTPIFPTLYHVSFCTQSEIRGV